VSKKLVAVAAALIATLIAVDPALGAKKDRKSRKQRKAEAADPYAEHVWPPPPDVARIKLEDVIRGRADVSRQAFRRRLRSRGQDSRHRFGH
jgi:hypothetical protein